MVSHRIYRYLGIVGAVLLPAIAVAQLLDLNVFEREMPISSSAMNDNFSKIKDKLNALETENSALSDRIATLEGRPTPLTALVRVVAVQGDTEYAGCFSQATGFTGNYAACARMAHHKCVAEGYVTGFLEADVGNTPSPNAIVVYCLE
jgi:hypothetical protein